MIKNTNRLHDYDDHCFCTDCCSAPERIKRICKDAEQRQQTFKEYVHEHMPQLSLLIIGVMLLMII